MPSCTSSLAAFAYSAFFSMRNSAAVAAQPSCSVLMPSSYCLLFNGSSNAPKLAYAAPTDEPGSKDSM
ncbi:Uncharacterised protein [Bordetella pertussis]|nr:Uncharacterised protein [Bordetella pertussis]